MSLKSKLEVISDLMNELMQNMEPGADDLDERLGRKKPVGIEIEVAGGKLPDDGHDEMMDPEDKMDGGMDEESEDDSMMSPLKRIQRLKKMG
jgi:hypothetical protein